MVRRPEHARTDRGVLGRSPLGPPFLVLASNVQLAGEDREAGIQSMYQQPLTEGIKKDGKRMIWLA